MSRNEKEIIKIMQKHIFDELDKLKEKEKTEMFEKADVLYNMNLILNNYNDLKPVLKKYFKERKWKDR